MAGNILISTSYLPPVEYYSLFLTADNILVELEENYLKQSYRNRCYILSASGIQLLTVPVYLGSFHKIPLKNIRIDYSKRWQQIHLGAINAAYRSSPFFEFYFEDIERIIMGNHEFLVDLNSGLNLVLMKFLGLEKSIGFTTSFLPPGKMKNDYRYAFSPKRKQEIKGKEYPHVFNHKDSFIQRLSIIDLLFNIGPESVRYL